MPNAVPAQVLNNIINSVALESASEREVADASDGIPTLSSVDNATTSFVSSSGSASGGTLIVATLRGFKALSSSSATTACASTKSEVRALANAVRGAGVWGLDRRTKRCL
jgi:hypothetical protein